MGLLKNKNKKNEEVVANEMLNENTDAAAVDPAAVGAELENSNEDVVEVNATLPEPEEIPIDPEAEKELKERRADVSRMERRITQKEENLDKKSEALERKNEQLDKKIKENEALTEQINQLRLQEMRQARRIILRRT